MVANGIQWAESGYFLGHSGRELRRLALQGGILRPITERLLRSAGIGPGMRVLDIGSGAGDVAMIAAQLVGPSGEVVGIDPSGDAIALASGRVAEARLRNVTFREGRLESLDGPGDFDAAIGRYVLIHQDDPVAFLRAAAGLVRPGGVVALHEIDLDRPFRSLPLVPLWQRAGEWIRLAFRSATPHRDAAGRLVEHFARAGLPQPALSCECPIGGGADSPLYAWVAETLESVLPQLERSRLATARAVGIESFEARLREAVVGAKAPVVGPDQVTAWARP